MKIILLFLLALSFPLKTFSNVIITGTRVIYPEAADSMVVQLTNNSTSPSLIQSWIDDENGKSQSIFSITPPLFKLPKESTNTLRIFLTEDILPNNRESLFWLNIKNIPSVKFKENSLQIAFRTQMKLIYRPQTLKNVDFSQEQNKLTWSKSSDKLIAKTQPLIILIFSV
ncbi:fimbrial biogenesis chaperone [Providencia rustigianii]|uniref:fimbrial biogenesis chaperone n=1 Tax=Providencia rustigianii TaxID=158850 RepID=UPI002243A136|nr:fimbria/pilus periplasmic chaperone [Providencia rustigianii]